MIYKSKGSMTGDVDLSSCSRREELNSGSKSESRRSFWRVNKFCGTNFVKRIL